MKKMPSIASSSLVGRGVTMALLTATIAFMACFILFFLFQAEFPGVPREPPQSLFPPASDLKAGPVISSDNTFKLAIFSDLHYGEEEHGWGIDQDIRSTEVMRSVLRDEHPDLVVVNGDLITGENTFRENASDYVHQIVRPMVEANTPWASTYGNHDSKFNLSREHTYAAEKTYPLSYTSRMDPSLPGLTNYYLLLRSAAARGTPVAVLWFFDSRGGGTYQARGALDRDDIPNWVADETAAWFVAASAQLRLAHGALPSLAFVHIPPHVFLAAQDTGIDPARFPGVNDDVPLAIQGEGVEDQKFVDALSSAEGLHSVYVGHDHGNAWCGLWQAKQRPGGTRTRTRTSTQHGGPPFLCFGKHTGYGGYGTWKRGSRVIRLRFPGTEGGAAGAEGMEVETWVRMEDSSVVTRVALNETYGLDRYPTANGEPGS